MVDDVIKLKTMAYSIVKFRRIYAYKVVLDDGLDDHVGGYVDENNTIHIRNDVPFAKQVLIFLHELLHDGLRHIARGKKISANQSPDTWFLYNIAADHIVNSMILYDLKYQICNKLKIEDEELSKLMEDSVILDRFRNDTSVFVEKIYKWLLERRKNIKIKALNSSSSAKVVQVKINGETYTIAVMDEDRPNEPITNPQELNKGLKSASQYGYTRFGKEVAIAQFNPPDLGQQFSRYMSNIIRKGMDDVTFKKQPSKYQIVNGSNMIFPSWISRKVKVLIGIDTSGSITDEEYAKFAKVIKNNFKYLTGKIVYFTSEIHEVLDIDDPDTYKRFNSKSLKRDWYGGTDFDPLFEMAKKEKDLDCMVVLTDLYPYSWPPRPKCPVLFIVDIQNSDVKVPYGDTIYFS